MVKICKKCGAKLVSGESNRVCAKCRTEKKDKRAEVNAERKRKKTGIGEKV